VGYFRSAEIGGDTTVRAPHPDLAPDQFGATAHRMGLRIMAAAHATHYGLGVPVRKVPAVLRLSTGVQLTQGRGIKIEI
jgi:hypothetical protein